MKSLGLILVLTKVEKKITISVVIKHYLIRSYNNVTMTRLGVMFVIHTRVLLFHILL